MVNYCFGMHSDITITLSGNPHFAHEFIVVFVTMVYSTEYMSYRSIW